MKSVMTKEQVVDRIFKVLTGKLQQDCVMEFHSDARLREDLGLDSSFVLQLLMHLELDYGLALGDEAMMDSDFKTIRSLANALYEAQPRPPTEQPLDDFEDLKIHCFASCLAEVVKRFAQLDHRLLYFGVWDSEVIVSDRAVLSYHSDTISHEFFVEWFERLYGMQMHAWYRRDLSKQANIAILKALVRERKEHQHIMVMLDMFHLPERVNEFNKDPFPHYLMLAPTANEDAWLVFDPDYRWEGVISRERILNAVAQPTVAGGYMFTDTHARPSTPGDIKSYFAACFEAHANPMTAQVRAIVNCHLQGCDPQGRPLALADLGKALEELPILAVRKYAYEHGLAFFWRELLLPEEEFDSWCEVIDELAKTYKVILYRAMKLAATGDRAMADAIQQLLRQQDEREFRLKHRLQEVFGQWCAYRQLDSSQGKSNRSRVAGAVS